MSHDLIPPDLRYTAQHEWVRLTGENTARVGITHFAQDALGDIVFVQLPAVKTAVKAGEALGEIESTKSVSDLYAPVAGTVTARNEALADKPELVNTDPYGKGWIVEIALAEPSAVESLLDAEQYAQLTAER